MGTLLNLQKLVENTEFELLESELDKLGITADEFNKIQQEALGWASRLSKGVTD